MRALYAQCFLYKRCYIYIIFLLTRPQERIICWAITVPDVFYKRLYTYIFLRPHKRNKTNAFSSSCVTRFIVCHQHKTFERARHTHSIKRINPHTHTPARCGHLLLLAISNAHATRYVRYPLETIYNITARAARSRVVLTRCAAKKRAKYGATVVKLLIIIFWCWCARGRNNNKMFLHFLNK